jgi:superfamily II DNA helicase RecQ
MADHLDVIISEKLKLLKISSSKAEQKQAVVGVLNGKDVMAILPTGFGKSLIFQLFTLVKMHKDELTSIVIVSPLTSIMEDQIKDFEYLGISAVKLSRDDKTLEEIAGGKYRVIFGSAEAVLDERFRNVLKDYTKPFHSHVKLIVVDECHTVET